MKTSELTGANLDYWVGEADNAIGLALNEDFCYYRKDENSRIEIYSPSTDWSQGGPIQEREKINLSDHVLGWVAYMNTGKIYVEVVGPTPLVAAMRCFVASRYGDEVPDEETKA